MDTTTSPLPRQTLTAILLAVCLASFATPFISSGVQIALPLIAEAFGVTATLLGWVPTAFLLPYAVFLLPFGKTADTLGRRRYFLMGIAVMGTGLICAGLAPSFGYLMAGMAIAGLGSAMTFATALPLLTTNYPLRERGKIIGINTAVVYVSLAAGPFLGGIITGYLGWRALFLVTAPAILAALLVGSRVIPKDQNTVEKKPFDYPGTAIYGASLILLIAGASRLPALWAAAIVFAGACGILGFFVWEARTNEPVFPVRLLRGNRAFTYSNIAALINYSSTYAVTFLLSLYLQYIRALTPQAAGTILLAQPILMAVTAPIAGRLSDRTEPRFLATTGMAIVTVCLFLLSFITEKTPLFFIVTVLMVLGLGYGIFSPPNMNSIMSSVSNAQAGIASATAATMRVLGQNLSMAVAMMSFSMVIGTIVITPDRTGELLTATHYAFVAFGILCVAGVWFSAGRGNIRERPTEETE
ncbi:MFS transporter [Methanogenium organophilum]|uniref:MFS transporter n=1 Tax=Methanogenium organophilum TaxID=2199 RepID=A0A9X9T9G8_METOG|nr:MFS transporter [Methanogenium organophilum]WAI02396.1 MFS transporter [Methanogenium organophilum]